MRKITTITYLATSTCTAQMLADPTYQEARVSWAGLDSASVDVVQRGQDFVVTIAGSIQPSQLPPVASRFVRLAVAFSVVEFWDEPKDDGSRFGGYDVTIKNTSVKVSATSTMSSTGGATIVTVGVDFKAAVLLVGKTIGEKVMDVVGRVVADEERRVTAWLTEHRFAFRHASTAHGSCTDH